MSFTIRYDRIGEKRIGSGNLFPNSSCAKSEFLVTFGEAERHPYISKVSRSTRENAEIRRQAKRVKERRRRERGKLGTRGQVDR